MIKRQKPSLNLPFATMGQRDANNAFQNVGGTVLNSNGTRINPKGEIETVPDNQLRIDYDPVTGEAKGLLVEEEKENLVTRSEDISHTSWEKSYTGVSSNAILAPNGELAGDKIFSDTTNGSHIIRFGYTFTEGTTYTISAFLKEGEASKVSLAFGGTTLGGMDFEDRRAEFDLSLGTITHEPAVGKVNIEPFKNGWYRCSLTLTPLGTDSAHFDVYILNDLGDQDYSGDGSSGVYVWGEQLEVGELTSYIPTNGSAVTKGADNVYIDGSGFSDFYNDSEGTIFVSGEASNMSEGYFFSINENSTDNRIVHQQYNSGIRFVHNNTNNTQTLVVVNSASDSINSVSLYTPSKYSYTLDGKTINNVALSDGFNNTLSKLDIGKAYNSARYLNGHVKSIIYYPQALPDALLKSLTRP